MMLLVQPGMKSVWYLIVYQSNNDFAAARRVPSMCEQVITYNTAGSSPQQSPARANLQPCCAARLTDPHLALD